MFSHFFPLCSTEYEILSKESLALPTGTRRGTCSCEFDIVIHPVGLVHTLSWVLTCPGWHNTHSSSLSRWLTVSNFPVVLAILFLLNCHSHPVMSLLVFNFLLQIDEIQEDLIQPAHVFHFLPLSPTVLINEKTEMKREKLRRCTLNQQPSAALSVNGRSRAPQHGAEWN